MIINNSTIYIQISIVVCVKSTIQQFCNDSCITIIYFVWSVANDFVIRCTNYYNKCNLAFRECKINIINIFLLLFLSLKKKF